MRETGKLARRGAEYGAAVLAATGLISLLPRRGAATEGPDPGAEGPAERHLPPAHHEHQDVGFRAMALGGVGVLLTALGVAGLAFWLYPKPDKVLRLPAPSLQDDTVADMNRFRGEQLRQLNGIYWVDRAAGTVHLPITTAMRLVAKEGIADWPTTPYPPAVPAR